MLPGAPFCADRIIHQAPALPGSVTSFGKAEAVELYSTTLDGKLHKVISDSNAVIPADLVSFAGELKNAINELSRQVRNEKNVLQYEIEHSRDDRDFQQAGIVLASSHTSYMFSHSPTERIKCYYRLKMAYKDGRWKYSTIILPQPLVDMDWIWN